MPALSEYFLSKQAPIYKAFKPDHQTTYAFKHHPQFVKIMDVLSRKNAHHVNLQLGASSLYVTYFLKAFVEYLAKESFLFHQVELIQLPSIKNFYKNDLDEIINLLNQQSQLQIFIVRASCFSDANNQWPVQIIEELMQHEKSRFIFVNDATINISYTKNSTCIFLDPPSQLDTMLVLKTERILLENFHQVMIPDDLLSQAYYWAMRYLSPSHPLEKTILLLDSAAARVAATHQNEQPSKPELTINALKLVLSTWTDIPTSHLDYNQINLFELSQSLHKKLIGQELGISNVMRAIQKSYAKLKDQPGPFCRLLLTGTNAGLKNKMVLMLNEFLFQQSKHYYKSTFAPMKLSSITELQLRPHAHHGFFKLSDIIMHSPFAVIMIENIEALPVHLLNELIQILKTGYLFDAEGGKHDFTQSLIILTSNLGGESLLNLHQVFEETHHYKEKDMMLLVMEENKKKSFHANLNYSADELNKQVITELKQHLPSELVESLNLVPFSPLTQSAAEQLLKQELSYLSKQLHLDHGIVLNSAPEIISFLSTALLIKQKGGSQNSLDDIMNEIDQCIEKAMTQQTPHKKESCDLLLQLNETGKHLRYEWLASHAFRQHAT